MTTSDNPNFIRRNSSVELFRILSILFVIMIHWNGWFVGGISTPEDIRQNFSGPRIAQILLQASFYPCVNMFLLISGYFGMNLKFKSILKIYTLLISIFIPYYFIGYLGGDKGQLHLMD